MIHTQNTDRAGRQNTKRIEILNILKVSLNDECCVIFQQSPSSKVESINVCPQKPQDGGGEGRDEGTERAEGEGERVAGAGR